MWDSNGHPPFNVSITVSGPAKQRFRMRTSMATQSHTEVGVIPRCLGIYPT